MYYSTCIFVALCEWHKFTEGTLENFNNPAKEAKH
jgi:hypothetical protein